ncbi:MAG: TraV family lipoprotein [Pseudomonadota bacterium]
MKPPTSVSGNGLARPFYVLGTLLLSACGNLTGLDGSAKFSCKAPEGVHCSSVTANYYNRVPSGVGGGSRPDAAQAGPVAPVLQPAASPGVDPVALRSPVRIVRLWIKAWEDSDRDLVDQSYLYVRVDDGQWQVAHVQRAARDAYAPLRPPASPLSGQGARLPGAARLPAPAKPGVDPHNGAPGGEPVIEAPRQ